MFNQWGIEACISTEKIRWFTIIVFGFETFI